MLNYFLEHGARANEIDHYGRSALHYAALLNKHLFIIMLIQAQANPQIQDVDGRTPLLMNLNTPKGGDAKTVGILLEAGSLPTTADLIVGNAFQYAQESERLDVMEILNSIKNKM